MKKNLEVTIRPYRFLYIVSLLIIMGLMFGPYASVFGILITCDINLREK